MITVHCDVTALAATRLSTSVLVEVFAGLRALQQPFLVPQGRAWAAEASREMMRRAPAQWSLLTALVPLSARYIPDFLTPAPRGPAADLRSELDVLLATGDDVVMRELGLAHHGVTAQPGTDAHPGVRCAHRRTSVPPAVARALRNGPAAFKQRVADAIEAYHRHALAPSWPAIEETLNREIEQRGRVYAARGPGAALASLHPTVQWTGDAITVAKHHDGALDAGPAGLVVVPSWYLRDAVWIVGAGQERLMLVYPIVTRPHGRPARPGDGGGLAELLGSTRATILGRLRRPATTTDLAAALRRPVGLVSYHLGVLARAGLVTADRSGRRVLYRLTPVGARLLYGGDTEHRNLETC